MPRGCLPQLSLVSVYQATTNNITSQLLHLQPQPVAIEGTPPPSRVFKYACRHLYPVSQGVGRARIGVASRRLQSGLATVRIRSMSVASLKRTASEAQLPNRCTKVPRTNGESIGPIGMGAHSEDMSYFEWLYESGRSLLATWFYRMSTVDQCLVIAQPGLLNRRPYQRRTTLGTR